VCRQIPNKVTGLEFGMPPVVTCFCALPKGLVLVTGPTGSGKTTTSPRWLT
jgi:twitching motility protein PilT